MEKYLELKRIIEEFLELRKDIRKRKELKESHSLSLLNLSQFHHLEHILL